jgi:hypothetical protein
MKGGWVLPRRFLVLIALMFWQGGFTFYAAVVVPIGTEYLGSSREQGFITRQVSDSLNLWGAVALGILAVDVAVTEGESRRVRAGRALTCLGMLLLLAALAWLRPQMDQYLDLDVHELLDRRAFRTLHRTYLWLSTFQWALGLVFIGLTLRAWRQEDRGGVGV